MSYYTDLFNAYKNCYTGQLAKAKIQSDVNELWKIFKEDKKSYPTNVLNKITDLKRSKTAKDAARILIFTRVCLFFLSISAFIFLILLINIVLR